MRIAVIGVKGLPATQGGIEKFCEEIYPRMVRLGHSVDLFGRISYTDSPWGHHYFEGVRVFSQASIPFKGLDALFSSTLGALSASLSQYDIVHFHALGPALLSWLPSFRSRRVVVSVQGLDWQRAKWGAFSSRMLKLGELAAVNYSDGLVVCSEDLRSYYKQQYGRETIYIPNGPGSFPPSDSKGHFVHSHGLEPGRYVIFLGRLVPEKCPDLLIRAFRSLAPAGWKLAIVGGSSDTDRYSQELTQLAAADPAVVFTGRLQGVELGEVLRNAGLFVLPSKVEGQPLAMLEAMQENVPVLASDIPPHQELLARERGLLFRTGDLENLIERLGWAIDNQEMLARMAVRASAYVQEHHSWDKITADLLKVYWTLLNAWSKPVPWTHSPAEGPRTAAASLESSQRVAALDLRKTTVVGERGVAE
ncbi:glycosyltransferase family 4 protein [Gloeobacter kilaueensis]|uniref:Lipopolysaccharide 1,2-N-acetylglucosaminetransferase n=1 Tax=Gloeobacter kilaueensis (strain ATCC BAA-2537 / CCAP 1431/1 / ULC 316 / JS1) TaxID=1183438 RepID=U5QC84_GLOK1|nr:glycosyltransferase family 4 protein [Gloeobacter kilaueensis]AGY56522.1 lipopolysaccharide 1,2-N-acetylglucosaminetransferase [Gloeobacter kilaueensis JS1]